MFIHGEVVTWINGDNSPGQGIILSKVTDQLLSNATGYWRVQPVSMGASYTDEERACGYAIRHQAHHRIHLVEDQDLFNNQSYCIIETS